MLAGDRISPGGRRLSMKRPISEQVVVITGASSGIGRETALIFGKRGAAVGLAARNEPALEDVTSQIKRDGGRALPVVTDVSKWGEVERLARTAVDEFGRIDTWVNNAGVSEFAPIREMSIKEIDQIIRVDLLGTIFGAKAVMPTMCEQNQGTIINIASGLADRSIPLQSIYCAAKHGVKGFTEALRIELEHDDCGVDVTLIQPSSINTPFFDHARTKMVVSPKPVPPVYEPSAVAEAILYAAEHSVRDVHIGAASKFLSTMQKISPSLLDRYMLFGDRIYKRQETDQPDSGPDNMFAPVPGTGKSNGSFGRLSQRSSLYTRAIGLHPNRGRVAAGVSGILGTVALKRRLSN
jgi:short-subunit dehydrogenase